MKDTFVGSGSSPRWRGAHRETDQLPGRDGIIPALAGSTTRPSEMGGFMADHPRVGGEHTLTVALLRR